MNHHFWQQRIDREMKSKDNFTDAVDSIKQHRDPRHKDLPIQPFRVTNPHKGLLMMDRTCTHASDPNSIKDLGVINYVVRDALPVHELDEVFSEDMPLNKGTNLDNEHNSLNNPDNNLSVNPYPDIENLGDIQNLSKLDNEISNKQKSIKIEDDLKSHHSNLSNLSKTSRLSKKVKDIETRERVKMLAKRTNTKEIEEKTQLLKQIDRRVRDHLDEEDLNPTTPVKKVH